MDKRWYVYILQCGDGSLYTGVAIDVQSRLKAHRSGKGAKYTRSHLPVDLVYTENCSDKSTAFRREWEIKHMTREEKLKMIKPESL